MAEVLSAFFAWVFMVRPVQRQMGKSREGKFNTWNNVRLGNVQPNGV